MRRTPRSAFGLVPISRRRHRREAEYPRTHGGRLFTGWLPTRGGFIPTAGALVDARACVRRLWLTRATTEHSVEARQRRRRDAPGTTRALVRRCVRVHACASDRRTTNERTHARRTARSGSFQFRGVDTGAKPETAHQILSCVGRCCDSWPSRTHGCSLVRGHAVRINRSQERTAIQRESCRMPRSPTARGRGAISVARLTRVPCARAARAACSLVRSADHPPARPPARPPANACCHPCQTKRDNAATRRRKRRLACRAVGRSAGRDLAGVFKLETNE